MAILSSSKAGGGKGACNTWTISAGTAALVCILGGLLAGFLVPMYVDDALMQILVCDENSMGFDGFKSNRNANTATYVTNVLYNITNPSEFLRGEESAKIVESRQYVYRKRSFKYDIKFGSVDADGYDTVTYKIWDQFTFDEARSCDGCSEHDLFYTMSIPYSGVLTSVVSEAAFLLMNECGPNQRDAIAGATAGDVCPDEASRKQPSGTCACCTIDANTTTNCATLLQPETAKSSALLSFLGRMDGGAYVRDFTTVSALGDSHGVHSPVIVSKSVREILLGFGSAIGGFGIASTSQRDDYALIMADKFTTDYGNVCSQLCPSILPLNPLFFNAAACDAVVPDTNEELATALGMSEEDVEQYSYLRKMSCSAYPWVELGRIVANPLVAPDAECVDPSKTAGVDFCCAWSGVSSAAGPLKGFGCLVEIGGGLNERMMNTLEESRTFTADTDFYVRETRTGCGAQMNSRNKDNREVQTAVRYKLNTHNPVWLDSVDAATRKITPMDIRMVQTGAATAVTLPIEGAYGAGVYPKGLSGDFFSVDVSDGKPLTRQFKVFPVTTRRGLTFRFDKTVTVNGIKGAKFSFDHTQLDDTLAHRQLGQAQPFKGLIAGFFYFASSTIVHEPLFAYADHYLLNQSDNSYLGRDSDTYGVEIQQTMSEYINFTPLEVPRVVTSEILQQYEEDGSLLAYVVVEPATGNYIEGHNRIASSFQVWECDPADPLMQAACMPMLFSGECYEAFTGGAPLPCSTANVLTPALKGGKVIPVAFTDEFASISNEDAETLEAAGEAVYIARILMVVLCGLGVCLIGFTAYSYFTTPAEEDPANKRKSLKAGVPANLASMYGTDDSGAL